MGTNQLTNNIKDIVKETESKVKEIKKKASYKPFDPVQYNVDKYNNTKVQSDVGNCE